MAVLCSVSRRYGTDDAGTIILSLSPCGPTFRIALEAALTTVCNVLSQLIPVVEPPLLRRAKESDDCRFGLRMALEVFPHDHISPAG